MGLARPACRLAHRKDSAPPALSRAQLRFAGTLGTSTRFSARPADPCAPVRDSLYVALTVASRALTHGSRARCPPRCLGQLASSRLDAPAQHLLEVWPRGDKLPPNPPQAGGLHPFLTFSRANRPRAYRFDDCNNNGNNLSGPRQPVGVGPPRVDYSI